MSKMLLYPRVRMKSKITAEVSTTHYNGISFKSFFSGSACVVNTCYP